MFVLFIYIMGSRQKPNYVCSIDRFSTVTISENNVSITDKYIKNMFTTRKAKEVTMH